MDLNDLNTHNIRRGADHGRLISLRSPQVLDLMRIVVLPTYFIYIIYIYIIIYISEVLLVSLMFTVVNHRILYFCLAVKKSIHVWGEKQRLNLEPWSQFFLVMVTLLHPSTLPHSIPNY